MTQNGLFDIFSNAHALHACTTSYPYEKQQELIKGLSFEMSVLARARAQLLICSTLEDTWAYHME